MEQLTQGKNTQKIPQDLLLNIPQELWDIVLDNLSLKDVLVLWNASKNCRKKVEQYMSHNLALKRFHSNMSIIAEICVQESQNDSEKVLSELHKAMKVNIQFVAAVLFYRPACELVVYDGSSSEIDTLINCYRGAAQKYLLEEKGEIPGCSLKEKQEKEEENILLSGKNLRKINPNLIWINLFKKNILDPENPSFIAASFFYPPSNEVLDKYGQRARNMIEKHQKFIKEFLSMLYDEMLKKDMDGGWEDVKRVGELAKVIPEKYKSISGEMVCSLAKLARGYS